MGTVLLVVAGLAAGSILGFVARGLRGGPPPPSFKRLTFRRGTVWTARFAPDGQTVVYGGAWENNPIEVFLTRPESPESRPLGMKDANLLAVSPTGELAVMLGARTRARGYERFGTLARVPLAGGSPRPVLEGIRYADWGPDGRDLMVEREVAGKHRIEFPIGKVLYESTWRLETPRVSPKGDAVAFFEAGKSESAVLIRVVDLAGKSRTLVSVADWWNLAWSPDGREILYAAPERDAAARWVTSLQAVSLSGRNRLILRFPGTLELHDVARDGRILLGRVSYRSHVAVAEGVGKVDRELSWLDGAVLSDISPDGKKILTYERGEGGGLNGSIYVRGTDGSPATLIGEGDSQSLSPDGRWVLAIAPPPSRKLVLLPTGVGSPRNVELGALAGELGGAFFPDSKNLVVDNTAPGQASRTYVVALDGGKPVPLGPPGLALPDFGNPVSPDGRFVALIDENKKVFLYPIDGGPPTTVAGLEAGEFPIQWTADGRSLYMHLGGGFPAKIWKVEIATGRRELVREIALADVAGVSSIESIVITRDGRSIAYGYSHNLSDLYIVSGLK